MIDLSDPISRQQAITALRALSDDDGYINAPHEVVTDVVRGLPPVRAEHEQTTQPERGETDKLGVKTGETCIDTISRQAACEYCREDFEGYVKPLEKNGHAFVRFGMDGWEIDLSAKGWHGSAKIMYCPMCGRELGHG